MIAVSPEQTTSSPSTDLLHGPHGSEPTWLPSSSFFCDVAAHRHAVTFAPVAVSSAPDRPICFPNRPCHNFPWVGAASRATPSVREPGDLRRVDDRVLWLLRCGCAIFRRRCSCRAFAQRGTLLPTSAIIITVQARSDFADFHGKSSGVRGSSALLPYGWNRSSSYPNDPQVTDADMSSIRR